MRKPLLATLVAALLALGQIGLLAAQGKPPSLPSTTAPAGNETAPQSEPNDLARRWGEILGPSAVSPTAASARPLRDRKPAGGLGEQLFFRASLDYVRNWASFSGEATSTFFVDGGPPYTFSPEGFLNFPDLFQEEDDKLYGRLTFGTKGYGSDRLNTYVSLLSYHDLDGLSTGSPFQGSLDSYADGHRTSLVNAYFEMDGIGTGDGFLSRTHLRVGRQYTHSYSNAIYPLGATVMDGAAVDYRDDRFNVGGFIGARSGIFSNPQFRFISGFNFGARLGARARFNYDVIYYAQSVVQNFTIEPQFEKPFHLQGFFRMVEDRPIDVGVRAGYSAEKWSLNANLTDRLTDDDFIFDLFYNSTGKNRENRVRRLYLGMTEPSLRFSLDGTRELAYWLAVGGRLWLIELHDTTSQGGFQTSLQDYSGNLAILPAEGWEIVGEYHFRDVSRDDPRGATHFEDIERAGETEYQEFTGSVGYRFNHRARAQVGTYYRVFDLQNRLTLIDDSKTNGLFANFWLRLTRNFDFRVIYNADNDFAVFNPDIDRQHGLRIGIDIHR